MSVGPAVSAPKGAPAFELAESALEPGRMLIEASAGTGKTYALAGLVLRLVVEAGLTIRQILTVTFTEAATAELRDRIRRRLVEGWRAFGAGHAQDALLRALLAKPAVVAAEARDRLWQALLDFDEAPIHTIHAFCQRVLETHAFETGQPFGMELVTDSAPLLEAVARDWWRRRLYGAGPIHVLAALDADLTVAELAARLEDVLKRPGATLLTGAEGLSLEQHGRALEAEYAAMRLLWGTDGAAIRGRFGAGGRSWANKPYNRDEFMTPTLARIDRLFEAGGLDVAVMDSIRAFTPAALAKGTKAGRQPPQHPFFDRCESLLAAGRTYAGALLHDFIQSGQQALGRLLSERQARTYHALLSQVADVLRSEAGERVASALATQYPAALIDEFQDTDPLQFEIFNRVFGRADCRLWMVGDPKQAIYGFRGADVFTYLEARTRVDGGRVYSLPGNRRSDSRLVTAVNLLFDWPRSFLVNGIAYAPVEARSDVDQRRLEEAGESAAPLRLWLWAGEPNNDSDEKNWARLAPAVAQEICRLVDNEVTLGVRSGGGIERRRLRASDIAVLVERHRDADKIEAKLRAVGIATSRHSMASVLGTEEAADLQRLLEAVAEPSNEPAVRAALGTRLLGLTAAAVQNLEEDEAGWRDWLERLHAYRTRWVHQGFGRMFRALLREQAITERLLGQPDGVRRITNLLHLAGLLGSAADAGHLQIRGLLRWLVARRDDEQAPPEEHLLRLERDDDAVRLLTAHASKGLQYPVVFCPYLQKPALPARQGKQREHVVYHRADESSEMVLDLRWQPDEASLQRSRRERLAEAVRLLYVALTRAEHRCYFAWGRRFEQRSGGPAWVFLRPEPAEPDPAGTLHRAVEKQGLDKIQARLQTLADQQPGSIQVEALPEVLGDVVPPAVPEPAGPAEKPALAPLVFTRQLDRAWGISSFSSLASAGSRGASDHADLPILPEAESEPAVDPLKEFGAGARLGECVHEILETWLMAPSVGPSLEAVAARKLAKFDLGGNGSSARLAEVLRRALDIELPGVGGARFRLSDVPVGDRLAEVKFHLPLRRITPDRLAACFEGEWAPRALEGLAGDLGSLRFSPREGYLTGSIDLVVQWEARFYLVDWKTNRLPDYEPASLRRAMLEHHYGLQYHLYALALDRFLAARMPGYRVTDHLGGVFYLFLRGLDPARPGAGVFHDRPAAGVLERLRSGLLPGREVRDDA